jgi:hypothetical protein
MAPGLRSRSKKRTIQQAQSNVQSEQLPMTLEQDLRNESTIQTNQESTMNNSSNSKKLYITLSFSKQFSWTCAFIISVSASIKPSNTFDRSINFFGSILGFLCMNFF